MPSLQRSGGHQKSLPGRPRPGYAAAAGGSPHSLVSASLLGSPSVFACKQDAHAVKTPQDHSLSASVINVAAL